MWVNQISRKYCTSILLQSVMYVFYSISGRGNNNFSFHGSTINIDTYTLNI